MFANQEVGRPGPVAGGPVDARSLSAEPTARRPAAAAPEPEGPQLRVHLGPEDQPGGRDSRLFTLRPDQWERLKIDLPDDWNGQGLGLEPGSGFGLLEIAGVRIITRVMGRTLWELLGHDLLAAIRATPATQLVSSTRRLRVLCTDGDTQLWLPEVRLPASEEPRTLEIGLRVRTGQAQITHVLHAWVEEADMRRREASEEAAWLREERDREMGIAREYLIALEMARTDGEQREAASRQQLASAHEAARQHAATLLTEIDNARADGDRRETAAREQLAAARQASEQHTATLLANMAAAQQASEQHAATLRKEIDSARAHGDERVADVTGRLERLSEQSQAQLRELQDRWQLSEQALTELRQQHEAERVDNVGNQGRLRSMRSSFSWRFTLPLRVLGRLLTGRKTARGQSPP